MDIQIAPVGQGDWEKVRSLMRETPMSASLPLVLARGADHDLAYPQFDGSAIRLVATDGERVVGYVHGKIEQRQLWRRGSLSLQNVLYMGDLRIAQDARRFGLASRLMGAAIEEARGQGLTTGFGYINEGNQAVIDMMSRITPGGAACRMLRTFTTVSCLLPYRPRLPKGPQFEAFEPAAGAFENLAHQLSQRFLAPNVTADSLSALKQKYPSLRFYREKGGGGTVAFALWDQGAVRELVVNDLPPKLRVVSMGWDAVGRFTGAAKFPRRGEAIRSLEVTLTPRKLSREALAAIAHESFSLGAHMFNIISDDVAVPIGGLANRLRTQIFYFTISAEDDLQECPAEVPTFVDLGFV